MAPYFSLGKLPVELVIEVFKSLGSIADVAHLAATSRNLYLIWKSQEHQLRSLVLHRTIKFYDLNDELASGIVEELKKVRWVPPRVSEILEESACASCVLGERFQQRQAQGFPRPNG